MTASWSTRDLERIDAARELRISVQRSAGTLLADRPAVAPRRWTPIWVVQVDGQVYVRSWYRRQTGWFGSAVRSHRARIRVPGLEADVAVEDIGQGSAVLRDKIDGAYRDKYGRRGSSSMITDAAAATTLRLDLQPARNA